MKKKICNSEIFKVKNKANSLHYKKTIEKINKIDWDDWETANKTSNIDDTYESFNQIIQNCMEYDNKKINRKNTPIMPWMTQKILKDRLVVEKARKKYR